MILFLTPYVYVSFIFLYAFVTYNKTLLLLLLLITKGQSNLTKSASRGAQSPIRGHPSGSKVVPLNSWGRVSY